MRVLSPVSILLLPFLFAQQNPRWAVPCENEPPDIPEVRQKADAGAATAQYLLGMHYAFGIQNDEQLTRIGASAGDPGENGMRVAAIFVLNQKGAPVRIVGDIAFTKHMKIENLTGPPVSKYPIKGISPNQFPPKRITELQLGYVTEVPPGCSSMAISPTITFSKIEKVSLDAGRIITSDAFVVDLNPMIENASKFKARRLFMQYGPVYARFADGTEWRFELLKAGSFDNHEAANRFACTPESGERTEHKVGIQK